MKATSKRLFSWLIVLAMVLSMVPVFDLPVFAANSEVAEEEAAEPIRFPSDVEVYEAVCPVCGGDPVEWKPYNGEYYKDGNTTALTGSKHYHLYLAEDKTYETESFLYSWSNVCFNLNGYDVTAVEGAKTAFIGTTTMNLMDTYGGSVVTGYRNTYSVGAAINVNAGNGKAVCNVYGGTYTKLAADTASSIVRVSNNGGTINWYEGAVIDATGTKVLNTNTGCAVGLAGKFTTSTDAETGETVTTKQLATFNMHGGEIKGGTAVSGGNVQVGLAQSDAWDCAVFNLYDGKVSDGTAADLLNADGSFKSAGTGGNFSVLYGGTLNVSGGVIEGGAVEATTGNGGNYGGNIRAYNGNVNISGGLIYGGAGGNKPEGDNVYVNSDATNREAGRGILTLSGGTIVGDVATATGDAATIKLSGAPKIVTSLEIDGETVQAATGGLALNSGANLDISQLSAGADIAVPFGIGEVFTAADANAVNVAGCFKSLDGKYVGKASAENQIYLADKATVGGPNLSPEAYAKLNAAAKVVNTDAAIDAHVEAGTCPMCGATGITWTYGTVRVTNPKGLSALHYYFDSEITPADNTGTGLNFAQMTGTNVTFCVALKSTADITCIAGGRVMMAGSGNVLNIMGTGKLTADQTGGTDLGLFQMNAGTLNLYGGIYQHVNQMAGPEKAVIRLLSADAVANIYNDAVIGPAALTPTVPASNVYMTSSATLNIYGGTIRNGVPYTSDASGNINVVNKGYVNMYGGTIIGGQHMVNEDGSAYNSISSTVASVRMGGGTFNMYGGTIQGGLSKNGGNGGGVFGANSAVLNIMGGTIKDGKATAYGGNIGGAGTTINIGGTALIDNGEAVEGGGNIYVANSAVTVNITGGTIRGGEAKVGGNIMLQTNTKGGSVNISGGVIEGGNATNASEGGGNIYAVKGSALTITGGTIKDGVATNNGGNIYSANDLNLSNVTVSGGEAKYGGNVYTPTGYTLTLGENAQILGGKAALGGGNISLGANAAFVMNGGVVANGTLTNATTGAHWGGNIRANNGKITINGGLIYGGSGAVSNKEANNIGCMGDNDTYAPTLTINGGTIVGDIHTAGVKTAVNAETGETEVTFSGTKVVLTGAPKIVSALIVDGKTVEATTTGLHLANGVKADISGLTDEAEIVIASPTTNRDITVALEGAETLENVFDTYDERYYIELGEDNAFYYKGSAMAIMDAEGNERWYKTTDEAMAAYYAEGGFEKGLYLRMSLSGQTVTLAGDAYLNLAGNDVTVAGTGTLYGLDSSNDDYEGYKLVTIAEGAAVEVAAETNLLDKQYIAVCEEGKWGFHRLDMWMVNVVLRTSNPGMYYQAAFQCDTVLRDLVDSFGVAMSLNAVPSIDFANEAGVKYTQYSGEEFAKIHSGTAVNTNSGAIVGILKDKNSQETNAKNLYRNIYVNAYITFNLGGETLTAICDVENAGKTVYDEGFEGTAYSLADILVAINDNWAAYDEEEQATILAFVETWLPTITDDAQVELLSKLTNIIQ